MTNTLAQTDEFFKVYDGTSVLKQGREYKVIVILPEGMAKVVYSEISRSHQSFSTVISVQLEHNTEGEQAPFSQRIDINSASAITDLRRSLDSAYGKQHNWTLVLNKANNAVRACFAENQKPRSMVGKEYKENPFLMYPFLQEHASNMVFGDSEVGKTYFCVMLAASIATGKPFLGNQAPAGKRTLFLDYEDSEDIFNNRLIEVSTSLGIEKDTLAASLEWYKPNGSLRDNAEVISKFVADNSYDLIVIDAGSNAAGGSPNDEQKVVDMFNSLETIPCTKLIIHHEPKSVDGMADNKAFYGTTFWRALTRVAWRLVLESEDGTGKTIKAVVAKKSNMGTINPITYKQTWGSPDDFENDPVKQRRTDFEVVQSTAKSTKETISDLLKRHGELTRNQIVEMTGMSPDSAKKSLQRLMEAGEIDCKGHSRTALWFIPDEFTQK
jgi:hypothetical protein